MQISQESTCVGVFFNKVAGLQNCTLLKRVSTTGFLLWILWIIQKHLFCIEDFWTAGSETPIHLLKITLFYRTSRVAACDRFRFLACNFINKGTPAKTFFWEFCKTSKNIFFQNTSGWLLLVFTWNFEKIFRTPILQSTSGKLLFHEQVAEFKLPDTRKSISEMLFKPFTRTRDVAIWRRSSTEKSWKLLPQKGFAKAGRPSWKLFEAPERSLKIKRFLGAIFLPYLGFGGQGLRMFSSNS